MTRSDPRRTLVLRLIALLAIVAVALGLSLLLGTPGTDAVRGWVTDLGLAAPVVSAVVYGLGCLSLLPKTVLTLLAGTVFGFALGLAVVVAGCLIGAVLAFLIGRRLGRASVLALTGNRFARIDRLLDTRGLIAVLFVRLVPFIPFTATNYLAGVTSLRLRHLVIGTAIGVLPASAGYVALGAYGADPLSWPFLLAVIGLVGCSLAGWWFIKKRRALDPTQTTPSKAPAGNTGVPVNSNPVGESGS